MVSDFYLEYHENFRHIQLYMLPTVQLFDFKRETLNQHTKIMIQNKRNGCNGLYNQILSHLLYIYVSFEQALLLAEFSGRM